MSGSPPAPPPPPPQPYYPPPQAYPQLPPPAKSHTALYVVVGVVALVVILLIAAVAFEAGKSTSNGGSSPGGSPGGSGPTAQAHQQNVDNTQDQSFGPGMTGAAILSFTISSSATAAWLNGSFSVTKCTSVGNYCLATAVLLTPTEESNWASGGSVSTVWCYTAGQSSCQQEQTFDISSGNLVAEGYGGQTLDLVLASGATTLSQQYTADVTLYWDTLS